MNTYNVFLDITMSYVLSVEAENEEAARITARKTINDDPYYFARRGTWVNTEVVDVEEEKEVSDDD